MSVKTCIKIILDKFGYDVIQINNSPRKTLLGLRSSGINTVIDVGANTGQFAKKIIKFFPNASIYCFEPLPSAFKDLSHWASSYGGKIFPIMLAIGSESRDVNMFIHEEHNTSSSILATTPLNESLYPFTVRQRKIVVKQMTLDQALLNVKDELKSEILIKIDVQGYEHHVISGAGQILSIAKACIVEICLDQLYEGQAKFDELFELLKQYGYRYAGNLDQAYADDGHCVFLDALFIR